MRDPRKNLYERYEPIRRYVEVGFWIVLMTLQAAFNISVALVDARGRTVPRAAWEILVWEGSSHLVLLALVPAIVAVERWLSPLPRRHLLRYLAAHALASVVFSVVHVMAMFALRALAYAAVGEHYDFADWSSQWGYEYLKDVRAYVSMVFGIWAYRLFVLRLQGEARVLDAPEEGAALPPGPLAETDGFEPTDSVASCSSSSGNALIRACSVARA
ncbi:hypothetical protein [Variovorax sp. PAMC26660]|uniref:hypothetical protein n=1 Tax=Variovorax sp. PAMC26660 TaxID=2762322 RepID=UPI0021C466D2|nr:hypothetical protein [Variovorax sp. PAMC26660]